MSGLVLCVIWIEWIEVGEVQNGAPTRRLIYRAGAVLSSSSHGHPADGIDINSYS